ncbi:MAG: ATP-binding protein, partial [Dehalococcoidales bacterium]|nr:ATP-binding protein [Dehalococcoidales bacterium]
DNEKIDYNMIHSKLPPINEFASPGIYIQIIDSSGNVVVKSDNLGNQTLPVNLSIVERGFQGYEVMETVAAGENTSVRIMATPLHLRDKTLLLEIAQSLRPINDTMGHLRLAFLGGTIIALALAVVSGAALVRRTLNPVERITRIARTIEASSDLSQRVGHQGPADEIGQLATTFDHMLERLHGAFQSQKHFVADASHELRTPLTVIRGNLDLLKRNLSEADRKECLKAIEAESGRMSKIVNDLLLLAEIESGEMEKQEDVSLKEIVLEEYKRAQTVAGSRRIVTGKLEDLAVIGDSYKLKQLLGNLVSNAIRYTPESGTVTLSVFRDDEWARLEVADTGIGIAPEQQSHIFDRFYRVDKARSRASGGTGLGLAIVKGIAEQHRGKVTLVSEPGKGSTFTAWLKL